MNNGICEIKSLGYLRFKIRIEVPSIYRVIISFQMVELKILLNF